MPPIKREGSPLTACRFQVHFLADTKLITLMALPCSCQHCCWWWRWWEHWAASSRMPCRSFCCCCLCWCCCWCWCWCCWCCCCRCWWCYCCCCWRICLLSKRLHWRCGMAQLNRGQRLPQLQPTTSRLCNKSVSRWFLWPRSTLADARCCL